MDVAFVPWAKMFTWPSCSEPFSGAGYIGMYMSFGVGDNYIRNHFNLLFINYPCDIAPLWEITSTPAVHITIVEIMTTNLLVTYRHVYMGTCNWISWNTWCLQVLVVLVSRHGQNSCSCKLHALGSLQAVCSLWGSFLLEFPNYCVP